MSLFEPAKATDLPRHTRQRTVSLLSNKSFSRHSSKLSFDTPPSPSLVVAEQHDAYGSFAPTSPASATLRLLTVQPGHTDVLSGLHGSLTRKTERRPKLILQRFPDQISTWSAPSSPLSLFTPPIPSISRSSSCASTSTLSSTGITLHDGVPAVNRQSLNPVLEDLEKKSKFCRSKRYCASCGKPGTDYPRCSKCGEMWCSRNCRLKGGKRHVCSQARAVRSS